MANDMVLSGSTELALDAPLDIFGDATGFEGVDRECIQTPFLKIAQSASDETKKQNAAYISGLEPGMFFCPSTRKVYGSDINVVLTHFDRMFVIYEGTGKESKYQGSITSAQFSRDIEPYGVREKSYVIKDGFRYVDTRNFLIIPYDSPYDGAMMMSLSSTGIKPSSKLLTQAMNVVAVKNGVPVKAPIWSSVWNLKTEYFSDPKGDYFQLAIIERKGWVNKNLAPQVKALFEEMQDVQVAPASETETHVTMKDAVPTGNPASMAKQAAGGENEEIF